jgi:hypothetical protein
MLLKIGLVSVLTMFDIDLDPKHTEFKFELVMTYGIKSAPVMLTPRVGKN